MQALTCTPIRIESGLLEAMQKNFYERELVVIVSTIAQVNFWTRMIQGIGVPPAGFSETCKILSIDDYTVLDKKT